MGGGFSFSWDPLKGLSNDWKHSVSFEEAATTFTDEHALLIPDPDHSSEEDRFILLGFSSRARLLVVVHCYRRAGQEIRIVSARRATRRESTDYARRWMR